MGMDKGCPTQKERLFLSSITKTTNCWGVENNFKGTNTNRIVLFRKA